MIDHAAQFRQLGYGYRMSIHLAIYSWCRRPFPPGAWGGDA